MKHITVRVEDDIYWFLKKNSKHRKEKNFSDYMRSLIHKGLVSDMEETYLKAESVYQNALHEARSYEVAEKEKEIDRLKDELDKIKKELGFQQKLLINICHIFNIPEPDIKEASEAVSEESGLSSNVRFHSLLLVEIVKKKGKTSDDIKSWLNK